MGLVHVTIGTAGPLPAKRPGGVCCTYLSGGAASQGRPGARSSILGAFYPARLTLARFWRAWSRLPLGGVAGALLQMRRGCAPGPGVGLAADRASWPWASGRQSGGADGGARRRGNGGPAGARGQPGRGTQIRVGRAAGGLAYPGGGEGDPGDNWRRQRGPQPFWTASHFFWRPGVL